MASIDKGKKTRSKSETTTQLGYCSNTVHWVIKRDVTTGFRVANGELERHDCPIFFSCWKDFIPEQGDYSYKPIGRDYLKPVESDRVTTIEAVLDQLVKKFEITLLSPAVATPIREDTTGEQREQLATTDFVSLFPASGAEDNEPGPSKVDKGKEPERQIFLTGATRDAIDSARGKI